MSLNTEAPSVDKPQAILAAALLSSIGVLVFNTMPVVVGGAGDALALPDSKLGLPPMAYMLGHTVAAISVIIWVRRVAWRRATTIASFLLAGGLGAGALAQGLPSFLAAMFVAGLGGGAVFGIAFTALGDTRNPDRSFGIGNFAQVVIPATVVWLLPTAVVPRWGFDGMLLVLAGLAMATLIMVPWMADRGRGRESGERRSPGWQPLVFAMLVGLGFFVVGDVAVWAFMERIGETAQVSDAVIGRVLALALLAAGAGSVVPVVLGDRLGRLPLVLGAVLIQLLCLVALASEAGRSAYAVIGPLFMLCWTVAIIYQVAAIAVHDKTGRYTPAIPVVLGVGSAVGPALGGLLADNGNFNGLYIMSAAALVVASAVATWTMTRAGRQSDIPEGGTT